MKRFFAWLKNKFRSEESEPEVSLRQTGVQVKPKPARPGPVEDGDVEFASSVEGRIEDGGPGKNVLIRNKYVREDTGTHETLKIIDDSILESDEESGNDPYNTGRFERPKFWDSSRSRK